MLSIAEESDTSYSEHETLTEDNSCSCKCNCKFILYTEECDHLDGDENCDCDWQKTVCTCAVDDCECMVRVRSAALYNI
jgi:hypothetical protein